MLPIEGDLTPEQVQAAQQTFNDYIESKNIDLRKVERQTGRSAHSIALWRRDKWTGNVDRLTREMMVWVEQHAKGESSGMPKGFITTTITERMFGVLSATRKRRIVSLITGPAGVSKTVMCKAAATGLFPGAVHIECRQGTSSARSFAQLWARKLDVRTTGSLGSIEDAIIRRLANSDRLQLIDEAQYLKAGALNIVRDVHKQADAPIALVGTRDVEMAVDDRRQFYGQWTRLIGHRYDISEAQEMDGEPLFTVDEIHRFAASMELKLTGDGAETATEIACLPGEGGLGMLAMYLLNADIFCQRAGRRSINKGDIIGAYQALQGERHFQRYEVERRALVERVKVA